MKEVEVEIEKKKEVEIEQENENVERIKKAVPNENDVDINEELVNGWSDMIDYIKAEIQKRYAKNRKKMKRMLDLVDAMNYKANKENLLSIYNKINNKIISGVRFKEVYIDMHRAKGLFYKTDITDEEMEEMEEIVEEVFHKKSFVVGYEEEYEQNMDGYWYYRKYILYMNGGERHMKPIEKLKQKWRADAIEDPDDGYEEVEDDDE